MTTTTTKFAAYGWLITKDNASDDGTREGVVGPGHPPIDPAIEARLRAGEGVEFRMRYNDRDEGDTIEDDTAYHGRFLSNDGDFEGEYGFGPLEDLGTPDAGCTMIEYRHLGRWVVL